MLLTKFLTLDHNSSLLGVFSDVVAAELRKSEKAYGDLLDVTVKLPSMTEEISAEGTSDLVGVYLRMEASTITFCVASGEVAPKLGLRLARSPSLTWPDVVRLRLRQPRRARLRLPMPLRVRRHVLRSVRRVPPPPHRRPQLGVQRRRSCNASVYTPYLTMLDTGALQPAAPAAAEGASRFARAAPPQVV
jgi:hypothetical protein